MRKRLPSGVGASRARGGMLVSSKKSCELNKEVGDALFDNTA